MKSANITFFPSPVTWRAWLRTHHRTAEVLWVGFYRKGSGRPSITWPESVDEALCHGWIDGIRKRIDEVSYTIRFTPRKPTSVWSAINIKRAEALIAEGRVRPQGLRAFQARREDKSRIYAYEQHQPRLTGPYDGFLKKNRAAFEFFQAQPPSYRKMVTWWVISAKREETRRKRLVRLIELSEQGRRL